MPRKAGAIVFLELGFAPAEARRLHAASRKKIKETQRLKRQLMDELSAWIVQHRLKQAEAAEILPPPCVGCDEQEGREVHDRHAA